MNIVKKNIILIKMVEDEVNFFELDDKNKQRSVKNILSKKKLSKYELDQIFAND